MDTHDTLLAYSEWLDSEQHLIVSDTERDRIAGILRGKTVTGGGRSMYIDGATAALLADVLVPHTDLRTHDGLAAEFIKQWEETPGTATLAGREPVVGQYAHSAQALGLSPVDPADRDPHRS